MSFLNRYINICRGFKRWSFIIPLAIYAVSLPSDAEEVSVYLMLGQSNMDGRGSISEMPESRKGERDGVQINYHNSSTVNSDGWKTLTPGFSMPPNGSALPAPTFGIELGFADRLVELRPAENIALLKVSKGATSLYEDWNPGNRAGDTKGQMFALLETALTSAVSDLEARGDTVRFRGVMWHQGEADAAANRSSMQYAADLTNFIGVIRDLTSDDDLPFVMGEIPDASRRALILQAQTEVLSNVPETGLVSVAGLTTQPDKIHLDAAGLLLFGSRYADEYVQVAPEPGTVGMAVFTSMLSLLSARTR